MPEYVSPEIPQDPAAIRQQMMDDLADQGVTVRPATATYFLLSVFAFLWARLAEQSSQVFSTVFRYFLQRIVRIPHQDAVAATVDVAFTAVDDEGPYDIPVGTEVMLRGADGNPVPFRTTSPETIPEGTLVWTPVTLVAVTPGAAANGLSVVVGVTQTLSWLDVVTASGPSSGGEDGETEDAYQNRGADLLSLPLRTLATPRNFVTYARNFQGVSRALALNDVPSAGHITVYLEQNGLPVSSDVKTALLADFRALSLTNLIPHLADPAYTVVNVAFNAVAETDSVPAEVKARAEQAVLDFLDPSVWGQPTQGDTISWKDRGVVRYQDVSKVLNDVPGLDYHTSLTINGSAADFTLDGPASLPDPASTASGTVTAL